MHTMAQDCRTSDLGDAIKDVCAELRQESHTPRRLLHLEEVLMSLLDVRLEKVRSRLTSLGKS